MKQRHGQKEGRSSELANAKERQRRATRRTRRREERREEEVKRTGDQPGQPASERTEPNPQQGH